jgi:hypothetical protein
VRSPRFRLRIGSSFASSKPGLRSSMNSTSRYLHNMAGISTVSLKSGNEDEMSN